MPNKIERDSAGLLMHAAECGVTDGVDDDADCTCGAHVINQRLAEVERLRAALRTEHFSSNGSSIYMEGPPEHDRSIARCRHPLCIALKSGESNGA